MLPQKMKKPLLTILFLFMGALPYAGFTLEDSYIFLAQARKFTENYQLKGTTSLVWGAVSVFVTALSSFSFSHSMILLKTFSFVLWLATFFVIKKCVALVIDLSPKKYFTLLFLYIILPISSSWAFSGMDVSLSILFFSAWLYQMIHYIQFKKAGSYYCTILLASLVFLIRPELVWLGLYFIAYTFVFEDKMLHFKGLLLWIIGTATSCYISFLVTGQVLPTSTNKIVSINIYSIASVLFFVVVNCFIFAPTSFSGIRSILSKLRQLFRKGVRPFPQKVDSLSLFFVLLIALRLLEHAFLGQIDHRVLAYLLPPILLLYFRFDLKLSKTIGLFTLVVYLLNIYNFQWYSQRTEHVHMNVLSSLADVEFATLATEEIGILSYYLPDEIKIYDYHGLNGLPLSDVPLATIDVAVFTGSLLETELLGNGFERNETICFEHPVTLYIRSIGLSPRHYCKTIYLNNRP